MTKFLGKLSEFQRIMMIDKLMKELSVEEARRIIYNCINESSIETIENFWFMELGNCNLSERDLKTYKRFYKMKVSKVEPSKSLYQKCIKGDIIRNFIKKNWRRLFNNEIIEKYNLYKTKNIETKVIR